MQVRNIKLSNGMPLSQFLVHRGAKTRTDGMPYIKIRVNLNQYIHPILIGKTLIAYHTSGKGYMSIIVEARTLVLRKHESFKIALAHIKTSKQIGTEGYSVYLSVSQADYGSLIIEARTLIVHKHESLKIRLLQQIGTKGDLIYFGTHTKEPKILLNGAKRR